MLNVQNSFLKVGGVLVVIIQITGAMWDLTLEVALYGGYPSWMLGQLTPVGALYCLIYFSVSTSVHGSIFRMLAVNAPVKLKQKEASDHSFWQSSLHSCTRL